MIDEHGQHRPGQTVWARDFCGTTVLSGFLE